MSNWKDAAHEAKDLLTVCLAKGIDSALVAQIGDDWFAQFLAVEEQEKNVSHRIGKPGQQSMRDMDLQGLLKFLRFRPAYLQAILVHYECVSDADPIARDVLTQQLNQLLDRLINDFRNRIGAHNRAADIEQEINGSDPRRIYGYEEALQDMLRLARIFSTVKDAKGVYYWRRIEDLTKPKRQVRWKPIAAVLLAIIVTVSGVFGFVKTRNVYRDKSTPAYEAGQITAQPYRVRYVRGELHVECYIINGTDETISNIYVESLKVTNHGTKLAEASFGMLERETVLGKKERVELGAHCYIKWNFTFSANTLLDNNAKLDNIDTILTVELNENPQ